MPHHHAGSSGAVRPAGAAGRTILLVDDHSLIRSAVRTILQDELSPVVILEAEDGASALRLLENGVDCVVLDISLPDISGLEVLETVRGRFPTLPVLMLSMHAEEPVVRRALELGASGYVTKGLAAQELVVAIEAVLSGARYLSPSIAGHAPG